MLEHQAAVGTAFEIHLRQVWGDAFDQLEQLIVLATEAGAEVSKEHLDDNHSDALFEVLVSLHARACQVANEILVLLKAGYADGAHARWRSLHEINMTAHFIEKHGVPMAQRYMDYQAIDQYKAALTYHKHCQKLGYVPYPDQEMQALKSLTER